MKARVFISCGQQKDTDEIKVAQQIAEKLGKMGFEPYIAVEEQTLKGLKENILRRLRESEYLIFIDFKRERLYELEGGTFKDSGKHRGSLFSHQELAVGAFLDIEALAFREKGVKEDDGILKFIQANCVEFQDRRLLPDVVAEKVRERGWNSDWRNELSLETDRLPFEDVRFVAGKERPARFYHIRVENHHRQEVARNCVAYLEALKDLSNGTWILHELVEFKWKGTTTSRVIIPPRTSRYLDAFHLYLDSPDTVHLGINPFLVDFTRYSTEFTLKGPGTFELTYVVFSDNFSPARASFKVSIGEHLFEIEFLALTSDSGLQT